MLNELPWLEKLASTSMQYTEHWTAVLTLLSLISCVYRDLHNWRSNQQPQKEEPKLHIAHKRRQIN